VLIALTEAKKETPPWLIPHLTLWCVIEVTSRSHE
jgi:hypothetical protein